MVCQFCIIVMRDEAGSLCVPAQKLKLTRFAYITTKNFQCTNQNLDQLEPLPADIIRC